MARFHNLKAQETERTHQFSWKEQAGGTVVTQRRAFIHHPKLQQPFKAEPGTYCGLLCSCKSRCRHFQPLDVPQHTPREQRNWRTNRTTYKNKPQGAESKHKTTNGPLFTVFRKQDTWHLHKKCVAPQDSIPLDRFCRGGTALEAEYPWATIPCRFFCYSQLSILETHSPVVCEHVDDGFRRVVQVWELTEKRS